MASRRSCTRFGMVCEGPYATLDAHYEGDTRFIIATTLPFTEFGNEKPPSRKAADLLVEFCELYTFRSQSMAAFLAAFMLPFHNERGLQPQLPIPSIAVNFTLNHLINPLVIKSLGRRPKFTRIQAPRLRIPTTGYNLLEIPSTAFPVCNDISLHTFN